MTKVLVKCFYKYHEKTLIIDYPTSWQIFKEQLLDLFQLEKARIFYLNRNEESIRIRSQDMLDEVLYEHVLAAKHSSFLRIYLETKGPTREEKPSYCIDSGLINKPAPLIRNRVEVFNERPSIKVCDEVYRVGSIRYQ